LVEVAYVRPQNLALFDAYGAIFCNK